MFGYFSIPMLIDSFARKANIIWPKTNGLVSKLSLLWYSITLSILALDWKSRYDNYNVKWFLYYLGILFFFFQSGNL